ncbi:chalcone isomerase family protein [Silvimonas sp.]|uniref:chalcone isomerase family protein n=1 Tax=Silvimonas sp. TaxID=2650811 RepID=UPI002849DCEB|nr:chalcone isomerase family protein [Silvimonas sp.]MDR3427542.1 chalcone isomerase family protein [Silvimonas sp.]
MSSSFCWNAATNALLLMLMLTAATASAGWRSDLGNAQLIGEGDFRYLGFKIYSARLFSRHEPFDENQPFALQLVYNRALTREKIADASVDELKRIYGAILSDTQLENWRKQMLRAFVDVQIGDQLTGVYLPGLGVRFYHGDALNAQIDDPVFARAFFSIWLDPATRDPALRTRLLGGKP